MWAALTFAPAFAYNDQNKLIFSTRCSLFSAYFSSSHDVSRDALICLRNHLLQVSPDSPYLVTHRFPASRSIFGLKFGSTSVSFSFEFDVIN